MLDIGVYLKRGDYLKLFVFQRNEEKLIMCNDSVAKLANISKRKCCYRTFSMQSQWVAEFAAYFRIYMLKQNNRRSTPVSEVKMYLVLQYLLKAEREIEAILLKKRLRNYPH